MATNWARLSRLHVGSSARSMGSWFTSAGEITADNRNGPDGPYTLNQGRGQGDGMLGAIREQLQRRTRTALDPPSNGHHRPDGLDHAEGPGALQESIKRAKTTSDGERQNEPVPFDSRA